MWKVMAVIVSAGRSGRVKVVPRVAMKAVAFGMTRVSPVAVVREKPVASQSSRVTEKVSPLEFS